MANKTFQGRIVQKHDTKANWDKATNFVPLKGEIIIYDDLNKIKIGDGNTTVGNLVFSNDLDTLATIAKTGNYNDLTNKPILPTKLSDLTDDVVDGNYLPLTGGTLTGSLTLSPGYLSFNDAIKLSGGISSNIPRLTITSALDGYYTIIKGVGWPESENDAANRKYVDNQIAANASSTTIVTWTDDGT